MIAVTTHHYAQVGTLAVCGQLGNGNTHMTHDAVIVRAYAELESLRGDVCSTCLAVAIEQPAATRAGS